MNYSTFTDYLADLRPPERLLVPPGGTTGWETADWMLCMLAERARSTIDAKAYLRSQAAHMAVIITESLITTAILKRLADWCDELLEPAA